MTTTSAARPAIAVTGLRKSSGGKVVLDGIDLVLRNRRVIYIRVLLSRAAIGMTQQYLAGELSVLLGRVQAITTTEAGGREVWSLRVAAETGPIQRLGWVTVRALALTDRLCWDLLNHGDTTAFARQAAAAAALREFGVCSGLLRENESRSVTEGGVL